MKMITGCFSTARTAVTCVQAVAMGLFLAAILSMDMASRVPGLLYNRLAR